MKWSLHFIFLVVFLKNLSCLSTSLYLYLSTVLHEQISDLNVAEPVCAKIMSEQLIDQFQEDRIFKEAISEEQLWQHVWKYNIAQWNVIGLCLFLAHQAITLSKSENFNKFPFINKAITMAEPLKSGAFYPGPIELIAKSMSDDFPFLGLLLTRPNKSFRNRALCEMAKNKSHGFKYFTVWMKRYFKIYNCEAFSISMHSIINTNLIDSIRQGDLSNLNLYTVKDQIKVESAAAAIYSGYYDFDKKVYPQINLRAKDFEVEIKKFYDSPLRRWPLNIVNAYAMKKITYLNLGFLFSLAVRNSDWQMTEKFIDYEDQYWKENSNNISLTPKDPHTEFGKSILENESLFATVVKAGQNRLARFIYNSPNGSSFHNEVTAYQYSHDLLFLEYLLRQPPSYHFASDLSISLRYDAFEREIFNLEKFELFAKYSGHCPDKSAVESVLATYCIDKLSRIKLINFVLNHLEHVNKFQRKEYKSMLLGDRIMLLAVSNDEVEILKLAAKQISRVILSSDVIKRAIEFCSLNYLVAGFQLNMIELYYFPGDLLAACQKIKYKISDEIANLPLQATQELIDFGAENAILPFIRRGLYMNPKMLPKEQIMQKIITFRHIEIWAAFAERSVFPSQKIINAAAEIGIIPLIELMSKFNRHPDQETINSIAANNYDSFSVKETILPDNCNEMILLQVNATHPMVLALIKDKSELECILKKYGNSILNQKVVNDAALADNYLLIKYAASMDRPILPHSENLRKSKLSPYQKKDLADILAYKGNFEAIFKFSDSSDSALYAYFTKDIVEVANFIRSYDSRMIRSEKIAEFALLRENERVLNYLFLKLERPIFPSHTSIDRSSPRSKVIMAKIAKEAIALRNIKVANFFATLDFPIVAMEIFSELFEQQLRISKEKKNCIYQDSFLGLSYDKNNDNKKVSFTESAIKSSLYIERIINENQIRYGYTSIHETLKVEFRRNEVKIYYTGSTLGILIFLRKKESIETIFDSMWRNSPEEVIISLEGDLKVGLEDNLVFVVGYRENYSKISKIDAEGVFNLGDNSSFNTDIENFHKLAIKAHEAKTNFWNVNKWNEGKGLFAAIICLNNNHK